MQENSLKLTLRGVETYIHEESTKIKPFNLRKLIKQQLKFYFCKLMKQTLLLKLLLNLLFQYLKLMKIAQDDTNVKQCEA